MRIEPEERPDGSLGYRVPEWLFNAYWTALFNEDVVPNVPDGCEAVEYTPETYERYWIVPTYSTWLQAEYINAEESDVGGQMIGVWWVDLAVSVIGETESTNDWVNLIPNTAYNPDSPFDYRITTFKSDYYSDDHGGQKVYSIEAALGLYDSWLSYRPELSEYTLDSQSYDIYEFAGENYYWFTAEDNSYYWYNILVHINTGNMLFMMISDGEYPVVEVEPLDDWYSRNK
jgi:hypothetical protein